MKSTSFAFLTALLTACGPADRSGTVQARLLVWNEDAGVYAPEVVDIEHLTSLRALAGRDLDFRAFATLEDLPPQLRLGVPFDFTWVENSEGEVVPTEYSSLLALTLYRGLDLAISEFRATGWEPNQQLQVLVNPRYDNLWLGDLRVNFADNAAVAPAFGRTLFIDSPAGYAPGVPVSINLGVIGHEVGHWVIAQTAKVEKRSAEYKAMDEGLADLFGFELSGDPDFINKSLIYAPDRNLTQPKNYEAAQYVALLNDKNQDPHFHGAYLARAIYEFWPRADATFTKFERAQLIRAVRAALEGFDPEQPAMAQLGDHLVAGLALEQRGRACDVLRTRMAPIFEQVKVCQ